MANRYWVGGTADWDTTSGTKWSTTSGGAGGAAFPTAGDDVFFDAASGASTVTITGVSKSVRSLDLTGFTGSLVQSGSITLYVYGSVDFGNTVVTVLQIFFMATTTGWTVKCNGTTQTALLYFGLNGPGGAWTLLDDLSCSGDYLGFYEGTFNANNYNITANAFNSVSTEPRTLNMGTGLWTMTGDAADTSAWNLNTSTGMTLNPSTSTIKCTYTASSTLIFAGGGLTYNNVWFSRGSSTGKIRVQNSSTFNDFKDTGSAAHTIEFVAGTTQTFTTFTVSGTVGNLISINSSSTATHALVKSGGGTISCDYLNIQHSVATPSSTWYAGYNSTNNQAVATAGSGWAFTDPNPSNISTLNSLAYGSLATFNNLARTSISNINGLT